MIIDSSLSKKIIYWFLVFTFATSNTYRLNSIETIYVTNEYSEYLLNKMYGVNNNLNILNINKDVLFTPVTLSYQNTLPNKDAIIVYNNEKFDFAVNKNEINNENLINLFDILDKKNVILHSKKENNKSQKKIDSLNNVNTKRDLKNPKIVISNNEIKTQNENINPNYWLSIEATLNIIDSLSLKLSSLDSNSNNSIPKNSELLKKRLNLLSKEIIKFSKLRKEYLLKSNFNLSLIMSINGKADYYLNNLGLKFSKYEIEIVSNKLKNENLIDKQKQLQEINNFNKSNPSSKKVIKDTTKIATQNIEKNDVNSIPSNINVKTNFDYEKLKSDLNINKPEVIIYFTENQKIDSELINLIESVSNELKIQSIIIDLNDYKKENENNRGFDYINFMKWLSLKL